MRNCWCSRDAAFWCNRTGDADNADCASALASAVCVGFNACVVGLGLLWLSGGWPLSGAWMWMQDGTLFLTIALYISASFRDPGYAPVAMTKSPMLQESLLATAYCAHCGAPGLQ